MIQFERLTEDNITVLAPFFASYAYGICDNTLGAVYQWRDIYVSYFAIVSDMLCIRAGYGAYGECYTVPIGKGDADAAFLAIEADATARQIPLRYCVVPAAAIPKLAARYGARMHAESIRDWADYLYDADAFRTYAGKALHTQKNHVNRFTRDNPDAVCVRVEDEATARQAEAFLDVYAAQHPDASALERNELHGARELLHNRVRLKQTAVCLRIGGEVVALAIGQVKKGTLYVHVEKARLDVPGAYPAIAQAFARLCPEADTVNREDDGGDAGLRYSKTNYRPRELLEKFLVTVEEP